MRVRAESWAPQRYVSGWLPADAVEPLLAWAAHSQSGETRLIRPLSDGQRQQVLTLLSAPPAVRRQARTAIEVRLTPRRHGYFIALGPLNDEL